METLTVERPEIQLKMEKIEEGHTKVRALILLTKNKFFEPNKYPWELELLGKSMRDWVAMACDGMPYDFVEYDGEQNVLDLVRDNLKDSEYTLVLFSDTPLIRKKTVEEILDYCYIKAMSVCKLTRGYVFKNDFVKNATELYTAEPQYFDEEDFMTAYNFKQLMIIEEVLKNRVLSFHMKNGVRILDGGAVSIDADVTIEGGAVIYPNNRIYGKTFIGMGTKLLPNNIIKNSYIGKNSIVEYSVIKNAELPDFSTVGPFEKIIK